MTTLRYGAKALIFETDAATGARRLLCLRKQGDIGLFYVLPGGGQEPGELLVDSLKRECREELGADVEVGKLRFVQEYVGANHQFKAVHGGRHFVNLYFEARLLEPTGTQPMQPDPGQVGLEWLETARLAELPFYPRSLVFALGEGDTGELRYLGDSV
jgi:8-oxo-dGTP diphosphatase